MPVDSSRVMWVVVLYSVLYSDPEFRPFGDDSGLHSTFGTELFER